MFSVLAANAHMTKRKHPGAVALGKLGGKARAKKMTKAQRSAACRSAALARWAKKAVA